jgi:hypothetical protein
MVSEVEVIPDHDTNGNLSDRQGVIGTIHRIIA